ncbi:MAG TPA: DUF2075 domain-containing protein [Candidatus Aquilonibacter sp.]|nr:DUF2075 domain-containing protein [Candidatus Aquilonibacter sp.]
MPAFFASSVEEFFTADTDAIIGRLTSAAAAAGFFQQLHTQTESWRLQIEILRAALRGIDGHILLEFPIPRRGKRIDTILLVGELVLVVEFKCGSSLFDRGAVLQVEDYCLDLRDFHHESRFRVIVPILVATDAPSSEIPDDSVCDFVKPVWRVNQRDLGQTLRECSARYHSSESEPIDATRWNVSDYSPTPTIVEAAQALYAGNNVREISRCEAGTDNLTRTTDAVLTAVNNARGSGQKVICFITGVPGAGKTLAGLNIVHNHGLHEGNLGVFLSGNGPLVRVLTEALARDHQVRTGSTLRFSQRHVSTFIQNVHRFIDNYFSEKTKAPVDRVVIFDEAQRAWDAAQSSRKFKRDFSEPEMMLDIMDRHEGWAVIVALVGVGQEINRGEAGLREWGRALAARFPHWAVAISPELKITTVDATNSLFEEVPSGISVTDDPALHLRVSLRSFKAEQLSAFVNALLGLEGESARELAAKFPNYPIVMTRSLEQARSWLRRQQRGTRRIGLIASSGGRRLRAHGLDVTADLDVENWFLNPANDVRSSFYLEMPATEFGIQGLELDWVGICWGGDLSPSGREWLCRSFRGTNWQTVRNEDTRRYIVNKYRVLLTRAREGMVIWVPLGDDSDPTRPPEIYDRVAAWLCDCGIANLASPGVSISS